MEKIKRKISKIIRKELEQSGNLPSEWQTLMLKGSYSAIYHRDIDSHGSFSNYFLFS